MLQKDLSFKTVELIHELGNVEDIVVENIDNMIDEVQKQNEEGGINLRELLVRNCESIIFVLKETIPGEEDVLAI